MTAFDVFTRLIGEETLKDSGNEGLNRAGIFWLIGTFQTFTPAFIAAGRTGGPLQSGLFYMLYIYNKSFDSMRMGYGAALAWLMTLFIMIITVLVFRSSKYWVYYETERKRN